MINVIDTDIDIVANGQVVGCKLALPLLTHTPDSPILSYLSLVTLLSQSLQKTLEDIKASGRKECQVLVEEIIQIRNSSTQLSWRSIQPTLQ